MTKTFNTQVSKGIAAVALSLIASTGQAAPVFFDFNTGWGFSTSENVISQGITFSPYCHIDSDHWLGFDYSGCYEDEWKNTNYLGPKELDGLLYIAPAPGTAMTLKSFQVMEAMFTVRSSKGGYLSTECGDDIEEGECIFDRKFEGPEWTNVQWLLFSGIGGPGDPVGFDDLLLNVHRVDEPGSLVLFGFSMISLIGLRARRKAGK